MNRRLLWLAVASVFIFAIGCDSKETDVKGETTNNPPTQTVEENDNDTVTEEPDSDYPPGNNESENDETDPGASEIQKNTDQDRNMTIHYPQFVNIQDDSMKNQINDLIKNEVTSFANQYTDGTLSTDFQIMHHTDEQLSIRYNADYNGGAYPTGLIFTTNIDLRNGEKTKLSDVININEYFVEKLKGAPYLDAENPSSPNEEKQAAVLDYLNSIDVTELVKALKQADQTAMETNSYGVFSYLEDDSVVVSIGVPHAIGDHAEFRVSLD